MAGFDPGLFTPTKTTAPTANGFPDAVGPGVGAHHGLIAIVLVATLVLFLLDRAGFRFAVTVGRG